jgi:hypothetical protein
MIALPRIVESEEDRSVSTLHRCGAWTVARKPAVVVETAARRKPHRLRSNARSEQQNDE